VRFAGDEQNETGDGEVQQRLAKRLANERPHDCLAASPT
jgi:hypothetical protein